MPELGLQLMMIQSFYFIAGSMLRKYYYFRLELEHLPMEQQGQLEQELFTLIVLRDSFVSTFKSN